MTVEKLKELLDALPDDAKNALVKFKRVTIDNEPFVNSVRYSPKDYFYDCWNKKYSIVWISERIEDEAIKL